MVEHQNGQGSGPFSQPDIDFSGYDEFELQANEPAPAVEPVGRAAGGFVPAQGLSKSSRGPKGSKGKAAAAPAAAAATAGGSSAGQYSRESMAYQGRKHGMSGGKKALIALLIVAVVAAVAGVGVYAFAQMKKNEINEGLHDMDEEKLEAVDAAVTGKATINEPFTVLLLGSDARLDDPDMGARTDTIILARVDPLENKVAMVSIPRDTMVEIDGVGTTKINAAYTYGGAGGAISTVKELTGVEIDHYAEVNFDSLVGLVDAIGGIDVYVDEDIDDEDAGGWLNAGQQHIDGTEALILARSRAYADGDYTRQVNQRKVIMAIIDRVMKAPASEMTGLINASTGFVTTDSGIDFDFILALAQQMRDNGNNGKELTITSATIPSRPAYIDEVSYVVADTAGVDAMMQVFLKCGDVSQPITESSIDADIAAAGGKTTNSAGESITEEYGTGYENTTYYEPTIVEEQTYVDQTPAYDAGAAAAPVDAGTTNTGMDDAGAAAAPVDAGIVDTGGGGDAADAAGGDIAGGDAGGA